MTRSLSLSLLLTAFAATSVVACPLVIIDPPPGTDVGLCANSCLFQCFYAQETKGVCSNAPAAYAASVASEGAEIVKFEVLSDKSCAIFSNASCEGEEVASIEGPGSVGLSTTAIKSVRCV